MNNYKAFAAAIANITSVDELDAIFNSVDENTKASERKAINEAYDAKVIEISKGSRQDNDKEVRIAPAVITGKTFKGVMHKTVIKEIINGQQVERVTERVYDGFLQIFDVATRDIKDKKYLQITGVIQFLNPATNILVMEDFDELFPFTEKSAWTYSQAGIPTSYSADTAGFPLFVKMQYERRIHMQTSYKNSDDVIVYNTEFCYNQAGVEIPYHTDGYHKLEQFIRYSASQAKLKIDLWSKKSALYEAEQIKAMSATTIETAKIDARVNVANRLADGDTELFQMYLNMI